MTGLTHPLAAAYERMGEHNERARWDARAAILEQLHHLRLEVGRQWERAQAPDGRATPSTIMALAERLDRACTALRIHEEYASRLLAMAPAIQPEADRE